MAVNVISTTKAPGAVGPYSQAIKAGDFLFASGQIAINPEKGKIVSGGVVDLEKTYKLILKEFREGKIGAISLDRLGDFEGED